MSDHIYYVCNGEHDNLCQFCDGGLSACSVCGAFEGAWPDECPGRQMSATTSEAVYRGKINYRDGCWREECCQVMRPVHDTEAFMAEHGYYPDGLNNAGNTNWIKRDG